MITNKSVDGKIIYKCWIFRLAMFDYRRVKWTQRFRSPYCRRWCHALAAQHTQLFATAQCPHSRDRDVNRKRMRFSLAVHRWTLEDWKKWIWRKATNVGTMMWLENTGVIWDEQNSNWGYMMGPSRYQDQTGIEIVIYYNDLLWTFIPFQHLVA